MLSSGILVDGVWRTTVLLDQDGGGPGYAVQCWGAGLSTRWAGAGVGSVWAAGPGRVKYFYRVCVWKRVCYDSRVDIHCVWHPPLYADAGGRVKGKEWSLRGVVRGSGEGKKERVSRGEKKL